MRNMKSRDWSCELGRVLCPPYLKFLNSWLQLRPAGTRERVFISMRRETVSESEGYLVL